MITHPVYLFPVCPCACVRWAVINTFGDNAICVMGNWGLWKLYQIVLFLSVCIIHGWTTSIEKLTSLLFQLQKFLIIFFRNLSIELKVFPAFSYGVFWHLEKIMVQCIDGVKHLCAALITCCNADLSKQPTGLANPEALARETVCKFLLPYFFQWYGVRNISGKQLKRHSLLFQLWS